MSSKTERPPVTDYYDLLDFRTYHHTPKRWVSLCVVEDKHRKYIKLYDWHWKGEEKGWKLSLAKVNVASLDLNRVAADAKELAAKYGIHLGWT